MKRSKVPKCQGAPGSKGRGSQGSESWSSSPISRREFLRFLLLLGGKQRQAGDPLPIYYDPELLQAAIDQAMDADEGLFRRYRKRADVIYEDISPQQREEAFLRLNRDFFTELGYHARFVQALEAYPSIQETLGEVFVMRARTLREEGADLRNQRSSELSLFLFLHPERLGALEYLTAFLNHELQHIADLLDPAFAYSPPEKLAGSLAEEELVRERYRLLWNLTVDSRLIRGGKPTVSNQAQRRAEFDSYYCALPAAIREQRFSQLWNAGMIPHSQLLSMARSIQTLLAWASVAPVEGEFQTLPLPGNPCPLCQFPTYHWEHDFPKPMIEVVQQDCQEWQSNMGLCERCADYYRLKAGCWGEEGIIALSGQCSSFRLPQEGE